MSPTAELPIDGSVDLDRAPSRRGRRRRWTIALLALLGLVLVLGGIKAFQIKTLIAVGKATVPPPESVTSARVTRMEWQPVHSAVGTLVAVRGVTLSTEVTGAVREINFENGALVKEGMVLVRLDAAGEQAQLASARADAAVSKRNFERITYLHTRHVNTDAEFEVARARDAQARAQVSSLEAVIAKKTIRAPFAGRAAIRSVELGQVLSPGSPIVSLQTVSPILAEFQLPQQGLADLALGQKVRLKVDVFPKDSWAGVLTIINPEVDPATRNVRIRATLDNPDGRLTPGMFASVEVLTGAKGQALVVPATSVVYAPYGDSVYVIEQPKEGGAGAPPIARQRFVRLGERRGDFVAVLSGLAEGERIVGSGAFKLRNGQTVAVHDAVGAGPQLNPRPVDR